MDSNSVVKTFFEAVKSNDVPKVVELLKTKVVDVNSRDAEAKNRTALHIAAAKGYYELTRSLVDDYKAEVNIEDAVGKIPLQLACDSYKMKIVKYLLEKKSNGRPYAERFLNDKIVDELFDAAAANNIKRVIELLKEKKLDVDSEDKGDNNRTILEIAARNGHEELVRILIDEFGADMTHKDDLGDSAKHMADGKYPNISKFLIERGWEDSSDESGAELSDHVG